MTDVEFKSFPKMARLNREMLVSEKIDGTNACIHITETGQFLTGSRNRWITPADDHCGFSAWAHRHINELLLLGPGTHFGEWWGHGVQRGYGLTKGEKRWSLFNAVRWCTYGAEPQKIATADPRIEKWQEVLPECCHLVPVLYRGLFDSERVDRAADRLRMNGSVAAPGFSNPEGVVVYHVAGNVGFKVTLENDNRRKTE